MDVGEMADRVRGVRWPSFLRRREEAAPPEPETSHPDSEGALRAASLIAWRLLILAAFLYVLILLLNKISLVTITITVAVMISAVLRPLVDLAVRCHLPRWFAAPVVFLLGVGLLGVAMWFVATQITNNLDSMALRLNDAGQAILSWLQYGPAHMSPEQFNQLSKQLTDQLSNARGDIASGALATANSVMTFLTGSILCLFAVLFLLLDDGQIWRWVVGLFPAREHERVQVGGAAAWRTLVAYMRSTIILALINALTMVPVMMFAQMDLVVPLAVMLFLGSLIPMIGMLLAGAVLMLMALVLKGAVTALAMGIALFLVIQLEGNLLNPYILGKAVQIHPLAILATVTGGAMVGGAFGAFVAVPLVAIVNNVVKAVSALPVPEPASVSVGVHVDVSADVGDGPGGSTVAPGVAERSIADPHDVDPEVGRGPVDVRTRAGAGSDPQPGTVDGPPAGEATR
ncbi:AI-2E family transporter [Austwickia chelonae]|uniref:AI-2E family transporter n=1 Tax=Austwickia chelonae NBRC 105200 TaxID=1184607 RepID=K6VTG2_9MICO|nr:AI-2E family transporter [Austwickia chelonae]GAB78620.1 hypothetical protein AUCHE_16_00360 [Austwickia chelonae NBRC 105200]